MSERELRQVFHAMRVVERNTQKIIRAITTAHNSKGTTKGVFYDNMPSALRNPYLIGNIIGIVGVIMISIFFLVNYYKNKKERVPRARVSSYNLIGDRTNKIPRLTIKYCHVDSHIGKPLKWTRRIKSKSYA